MSYKNSPHIIIHLLGFFTVLSGSILLIFFNLFHTPQNTRFSPRDLISPKTLFKIFKYRHDPGISCQQPENIPTPSWLRQSDSYQVIAPIDNSNSLLISQQKDTSWSILKADNNDQSISIIVTNIPYQGTYLTKSYAPILDTFYYPNCADQKCYIWKSSLSTNDSYSFPAFAAADKLPVGQLANFFFDEARELVSYNTRSEPNSPRLVINQNLELIQSIQELPHPSRPLQFQSYLPTPGLLHYHDPKNSLDYFYLIDNIALYRHKCQG